MEHINALIYANLFDDEAGDGFTLIWPRGRKANGEAFRPGRCRG